MGGGRVQLDFVWFAGNITDDRSASKPKRSEIYRWPAEGWVSGDVDDLADLCESASAPPRLVRQQAKEIGEELSGYAEALQECLDEDVAKKIAHILGQESVEQGLRLACCIWMTSCRLHDQLASHNAKTGLNLKSIPAMRAESQGIITLTDLWEAWKKIYDYNYRSIFGPALVALHPNLPTANGAGTIDKIARVAERVKVLRLGHSVDFAGELFPELLMDRSEIAAFYTLPANAELLANLAVNRLAVKDWGNPEDVKMLKVADLACGTGALLRAAYARIRAKHDARGGDVAGLHADMMRHAITGLDVNSLATHMTSAGLSGMEIAERYRESKIGSVRLTGGRTGSLDLLTSNEVVDITGKGVRLTELQDQGPRFIAVPNKGLDLVIQNPPYSRSRGGRQLFDMAGMTDDERKRSKKTLGKVVRKLRRPKIAKDASGKTVTIRRAVVMPNGHAGLGTHFSALADLKLKDGGVFSSVLPLTAAHGDSWSDFRSEMAERYSDIMAIAVSPERGVSLSADTGINELLVIATKSLPSPGTHRQPNILCINLDSAPEHPTEAAYMAREIRNASASGDSDGVLTLFNRPFGNFTRFKTPAPEFPWLLLGASNLALSRTVAAAFAGDLYFEPSDFRVPFALQFAPIKPTFESGPSQDKIGHLRTSKVTAAEGRGAMTFDAAKRGQHLTRPSIWNADAKSQIKLVVQPTHEGHLVSGKKKKAKKMMRTRSHLVISKNFRMTSQALAAAWVCPKAMGGRNWLTLNSSNGESLKAALLWLNSTLGLATRVAYAQTTQTGRATMQVGAIEKFPVPNFAEDSAPAHHARDIAAAEFPHLSQLRLQPAAYAWTDPARHQIDDVVLRMLGIDSPEARDAVDQIRRLWCREPSVHGGKKDIKRKLGIE